MGRVVPNDKLPPTLKNNPKKGMAVPVNKLPVYLAPKQQQAPQTTQAPQPKFGRIGEFLQKYQTPQDYLFRNKPDDSWQGMMKNTLNYLPQAPVDITKQTIQNPLDMLKSAGSGVYKGIQPLMKLQRYANPISLLPQVRENYKKGDEMLGGYQPQNEISQAVKSGTEFGSSQVPYMVGGQVAQSLPFLANSPRLANYLGWVGTSQAVSDKKITDVKGRAEQAALDSLMFALTGGLRKPKGSLPEYTGKTPEIPQLQNVANDVIEGKKGLGSAAWSVAQPATRGMKSGSTESKLRNELADLQTQRMKASLAVERPNPRGYQSGIKFSAKEVAPNIKSQHLQEARKYKSAEEFVKAQESNKLFHGTQQDFDTFDVSKGHDFEGKRDNTGWGKGVLSFTKSERNASAYTLDRPKIYSGGKPQVKEAYVDLKNPFVIGEYGDIGRKGQNYGAYQKARDGFGKYNKIPAKNNARMEAFVKDLKAEGYDGIIMQSENGPGEYVAFSNDQIKTKSQLTDIWNKSQPLQEGGIVKGGLQTKGEITTPNINYKKFIEENLGLRNKTPDTRGFNKPISQIEQKLKDPALFVQDMEPGATKTFGTPRKTLTSGERILRESGEGGNELANRIQRQQQDYQLAKGHDEKFIDDVFRGFSKDEALEVTDILEGVKPTSLKTGTAAKILRNWLNKRQSQAVEKGLDVGYLENYYPRKYDFSELTKSGRKEEVLQQLVDSGQAKTKADAENILKDFIFKNTERKSGNLEFERLHDMPGYERDPRVALKQYADSVAGRLTEVSHFGKKDEIASALINKISEGGGDYREAQRIFDFMYKGEPQNKLVNNLTKFQALTKLSLAFFSNATQSVNTLTKGDFPTTAKAIVKNFTDFRNQDDFAKIAGVYQDMNIKQELGFEPSKLMNFVMKPFNIVERFNRRVAAGATKFRVENLVEGFKKNPDNKYFVESLEKLGIEPQKLLTGKLTEQDLLRAANNFTYKTQFLANAFNLPPAWRTPTGKLLSQFKSFSFMQTKFVRDEVLKEARKGNVAPLVKFLFMAPVASFAAQTLRNKVNMVSPEKEAKQGTVRPWDKYLKAYGTIPTDLATQMEYSIGEAGKPYTTQIRNIKNFASPFIGPTIGEIGDIANAAESSYQTGKTNRDWYSKHPAAQQNTAIPWERYAASHIPFAGRSLMNTVFDYKPTVANQAKDMARQAIESNDVQGFNEALKKDPYLNSQDAIRAAIGKKVSEMSPTEKKFYDMLREVNPFYQN